MKKYILSFLIFLFSASNIFAGTTSSGNLGIGTVNPRQKVDVMGNGVFSGSLTAASFSGDGSGLTGITGGGGLGNVVEDTTPQLGGDLDMNGNSIDFPSTANISDVLDEDNMASNSATKLATQQSIKAYVDTAISGVSGGSGGWTDGGTYVYLTATSDTVGVGTTTPNAQLMISNVGTADSFRVDDSLNDASPFLINSAGNVGIGTTTAGAKLSIGSTGQVTFDASGNVAFSSSTGGTDTLNISNGSLTSANALDVSSGSSSQTGALVILTQSGASSGGTLRVNQTSATSTGRAGHFTNAGTGETFLVEDVATDSSPFLIGSDGNVGIGTTTVSSYKLRVVGTVSATAFVGDGSGLTGLASASGWTDGGTNIYPTLTSDQVAIGTTTPISGASLTVLGTLAGAGTGPIAFTNANVGIGTTTAGALLTVGSTGQATIDSSGIIQPAGYKSADGTTGATVTTCTGFKNGLCISGT